MRRVGKITLLLMFLATLWLFWYSYTQQVKQRIKPVDTTPVSSSYWEFQSIDTMKYSRDLAREKLKDNSFDAVIEKQISDIAATGATHVGIATPYDPEFLPFLRRWVDIARKHNLNVWYRGNWAGWEGWFGYSKITRKEHISKSVQFIKDNADLFKSGDVFSACPECENGGPGDPRLTQDIAGHRKFLIDEYKAVSEIFRVMGKNVKSNFSPMNGDVAKAIMDPQTTKALGGVVVVDHYVKTGKELATDIQELADNSKGYVILGEFGAPIYDIHGKFNEVEQAAWIKESLEELTRLKVLKGVNYWVSHGGSTQIWNDEGKPKSAVEVLTAYYKPKTIIGSIYNELNEPISNAEIVYNTMYLSSDKEGQFIIKDNEIDGRATIFANGYKQKNILVNAENTHVKVILEKVSENPWFKFRKFLINL